MIKKVIGLTILLSSSLLTYSQKINTKKPFHPKYNYMQLIDSTPEKIDTSKLKPSASKKGFSYAPREELSDGTIIEKSGYPTEFMEIITPGYGWFIIQKIFHKNGMIAEKGILSSSGKEYGKWYTFDSTGSLIKTIDYDAPYKLHFEQLLRLAADYSRKYGYDVHKTDINASNTFDENPYKSYVSIKREQNTLGNMWTIILSRFNKTKYIAERKIIAVDDSNGNVVSVKDKTSRLGLDPADFGQ